jgi:hypothetical protein
MTTKKFNAQSVTILSVFEKAPLLLGISTIRQTTLALVNLLCISG